MNRDLTILTRKEIMDDLINLGIPFSASSKKQFLLDQLLAAERTTEANTAATNISFQGITEDTNTKDPNFEKIERLYELGVLSKEERKQHHLALIEGKAMKNTPPTDVMLTLSETGEKKKEFFELRRRLVGDYQSPRAGEELRDFIRTFPSSATYLADPQLREHFQLCINHYKSYHQMVAVHTTECPDTSGIPGVFLEDFRAFLGHMAAIFYLSDGAHHQGNKKIGGMAKSFSCKLTLLAEDLAMLQRSEGDDIITQLRKMKGGVQQEVFTSQQPTRTNQHQSTTPLTLHQQPTTNKEPVKRVRECEWCMQNGLRHIAHTHSEDTCRRKGRPIKMEKPDL